MAKIRLREQAVTKRRETKKFSETSDVIRFSDTPTDYACFNDAIPLGIPIFKPVKALEYFLGLIPSLSHDPQFSERHERQSFTLASATEETLLGKVKNWINESLRGAKSMASLVGDIDQAVEELGVTPKNPQYAEMVARTNMMDALNTGSHREQVAVKDTFPVWEYSAIVGDGRGRPSHSARNGKYYAADRTFSDVRGTDPGDVCNCRCTFIPVDKWEWEDLLNQGKRVEE